MNEPPTAAPLPPGFRLVAELARGPGSARVVRARRGDEDVVLRLDPEESAGAELAVLAAALHPGLARLVDHGPLAGGGGYVARTWVEGATAADWASERTPEQVGALIARLCPALEHLHATGFVHADLKPENVIVRAGGAPVLTDFGLARREGSRSDQVSGSFFYLAPEVLLGARADARADLFALGAMLHRMLIPARVSAAELYGRFPAEDFFTATRTAAHELPSWCRDVVPALLERDPARRPSSAAQVGRTLAGRLGLGRGEDAGRARLAWPVEAGRAEWCERAADELLEGGRASWLRFPVGEEPGPLLGRLALDLALRGAAVRRLDLRRELEDVRDDVALDRWALAACAGERGDALLVEHTGAGPWALRALTALARAWAQRELGTSLAVGSGAPPVEAGFEWSARAVPSPTPADVLALLEAELEPDARLGELAEALAAAARGSATAVEHELAELSREGWFAVGDERPRLRPGVLPSFAHAEEALDLSADARRTASALRVLADRARIEDLAALLERAPAELGPSAAELVSAGVAQLEPSGELRARTSPPAEALCTEDEWRALHLQRARQLAEAPAERRLPHAYRAGQASSDELTEACRDLLERGAPERVLELTDRLAAMTRELGVDLPGDVRAERALALCALGDSALALDEAAELEGALLERVRGRVAELEHRVDDAVAHFARARELDPRDGGQAELARARALYEAGRHDVVLDELEQLFAPERSGVTPRVRDNARAIRAMSLFRTGNAARARDLLEDQLAEAGRAGDRAREGGLCINLATVERRAGDRERATELLERAVASLVEAGRLPGVAQARAMLGGLLRDAGELKRAQPLLDSALSIRERLGDAEGAVTVRGMLGLLLAERGHARAAIEELERSAARARRTADALLLRARADETRARLGDLDALAEEPGAGRLGEGDPRILSARGRTALLAGRPERAAELATRALELAQRLDLGAATNEAEALRRRIAGEAGQRGAAGPATSLADQDERTLAALSATSFDEATALQLADELARQGRDDRAARVLLAAAARCASDARALELCERAREPFEACARGLSPIETSALRHTLLGVPDPWPEDLVSVDRRTSRDEEDEMEVIKLLEINHRLVTQEDLGQLLGTIVEQSLQVSGGQRGFLVLEEDGELAVDTALDSRRGGIEEPDVEFSGSVLRRALDEGAPVRISNAVEDPSLGGAPSVVDLQLRSILCVPFDVERGLRGVIYVDHRLREAAFDARTEKLLVLLADQAALAIRQTRRVQEIRQLNRELEGQVERQETDLRTARERLRVAGLASPVGGLVGDAPAMRATHGLIERAAQADLAVLVGGESGTGKELAARALHDLGRRADGPFVSENCAAIPASLIESELFGARRGAFTGADRDRAGLFERAHGGTLFLDELGELPLELQAKLLRVIETGVVRRLGDNRERSVDFRLVAATNRDLQAEVTEGRFRADLFYRLDGLRIDMPALRDHPEDIPALVEHFFHIQQGADGEPPELSKPVLARLCEREWPGNVRELFNELARLVVLSEGAIDDPDLIRAPQVGPAPASVSGEIRPLAALEREAIEHALRTTAGDKRKAADLLGISRAKIYQRLKEWRDPDSPSEGQA